MSGRTKEKVFVYHLDGTFYKKFDSMSEYGKFFNMPKNSLIVATKGYNIIDDYYIATKDRLGKQKIRDIIKYENSPYVGDGLKRAESTSKQGEVKMYNLDGELIAWFKSHHFMKKLTDYGYCRLGETNTLDGLKIIVEERN